MFTADAEIAHIDPSNDAFRAGGEHAMAGGGKARGSAKRRDGACKDAVQRARRKNVRACCARVRCRVWRKMPRGAL